MKKFKLGFSFDVSVGLVACPASIVRFNLATK